MTARSKAVEDGVRGEGAEVLCSPKQDSERSGIVTFRPAGESATDAYRRLSQAGFFLTERAGFLRVASHATTHPDAPAALAEVLRNRRMVVHQPGRPESGGQPVHSLGIGDPPHGRAPHRQGPSGPLMPGSEHAEDRPEKPEETPGCLQPTRRPADGHFKKQLPDHSIQSASVRHRTEDTGKQVDRMLSRVRSGCCVVLRGERSPWLPSQDLRGLLRLLPRAWEWGTAYGRRRYPPIGSDEPGRRIRLRPILLRRPAAFSRMTVPWCLWRPRRQGSHRNSSGLRPRHARNPKRRRVRPSHLDS